MYYLLLYDVVDDFIGRRAPFRHAHLAHTTMMLALMRAQRARVR
jgi:hypothetical protein